MSKHTPGPWSLLVPHEMWCGRPIDDWAITVDDHDTWICTGPTWDADKQAESAANGRLIAAAPELLEALLAVVSVADRATVAFDKARAAIAKATGATP